MNSSARGRFLSIAVVCLALVFGSCSREADRTRSYVASLRCGMTRDEVTRLAREHGYDRSDKSWLARSAAKVRGKELALVDLTFRGGRLVAVREGRYDPRTKRVEYRDLDLCGAAPPR